MRSGAPMSFVLTITTRNNNNLVKYKARMANERRKQAVKWLRRQAEQKKPDAKDAPCLHQM
jgi:ribosome recycling factor